MYIPNVMPEHISIHFHKIYIHNSSQIIIQALLFSRKIGKYIVHCPNCTFLQLLSIAHLYHHHLCHISRIHWDMPALFVFQNQYHYQHNNNLRLANIPYFPVLRPRLNKFDLFQYDSLSQSHNHNYRCAHTTGHPSLP